MRAERTLEVGEEDEVPAHLPSTPITFGIHHRDLPSPASTLSGLLEHRPSSAIPVLLELELKRERERLHDDHRGLAYQEFLGTISDSDFRRLRLIRWRLEAIDERLHPDGSPLAMVADQMVDLASRVRATLQKLEDDVGTRPRKGKKP